MLKSHQAKRLIEKKASSVFPGSSYLGCARGRHYLEVSQDGGVRRILSLYLNSSERQLEARFGVSFLGRPGAISLAPFLSEWKSLHLPDLEFSSKKTARRALERLFANFDPALHGHSATLERELEKMAQWHSFLERHRDQLARGDEKLVEELKRSAPQEIFHGLMAVARLGENEPSDEEELESLLDSLAEEGSFQATSGFTLDRSRALQKLTDFQLGEPVLCPLFLAVGLSLLGARRLEIEVDSDETWVRYQGVEIGERELQALSSVLLTSRLSSEQIGWDFLAKGLLQAVGREPRMLTLEAGSVFDLRGFPETVETRLSSPLENEGTFYCRTTFGVEVLKRFVGSLSQDHPEVEDLRNTLRYLSLEWVLNGDLQKGRVELEEEAIALLFLNQEAPAPEVVGGQLKVVPSPIPASVLVVLNRQPESSLTAVLHQMVVELPEELHQPDTRMVVWLPEMALDLSGRRLVASQLLLEIGASLASLEQKIWESLAEFLSGASREQRLFWQQAVLDRWDSEGAKRLGTLPILPRIESEPTTLAQYREAIQLYTLDSFEKALRSGTPVVEVSESAKTAFLRHFPQAIDATASLEKTAFYYRKYQEWLSLPEQEASLQSCPPEWSLQFDYGWLGFSDQRQPEHQLLCLGRPLPAELSDWAPPYLELALFYDSLEMDDDWTRPGPDSALEFVKGQVRRELKRLLGRFEAKHLESDLCRDQLGHALVYLERNGVTFTTAEQKSWDKLLSESDLNLDSYRD